MTSKSAQDTAAYEASVIAGAVSWTAFQFRGPFDRQRAEAATREEAEAEGRRLVAEYDRKPAMIYAVNAEGRSVLAGTINPER